VNRDDKLIFEVYRDPKPYGSYHIDHVISYMKSIQPQLDEARDKIAQEKTDLTERDSLLSGHGKYIGSCGHVIKQCRCAQKHPDIQVDVPCLECYNNSKTTI
jgi:hypothetical protein